MNVLAANTSRFFYSALKFPIKLAAIFRILSAENMCLLHSCSPPHPRKTRDECSCTMNNQSTSHPYGIVMIDIGNHVFAMEFLPYVQPNNYKFIALIYRIYTRAMIGSTLCLVFGFNTEQRTSSIVKLLQKMVLNSQIKH